MKKIYVGCVLTEAPDSFKDEVRELIKLLRDEYEVLPFFTFSGKEYTGPRDLFDYDIEQIERADFVVAICSYASTGLGYEIAHALSLGKPVFAFAKVGENVSKFIDGGINNPEYRFLRLESLSEVPENLK